MHILCIPNSALTTAGGRILKTIFILDFDKLLLVHEVIRDHTGCNNVNGAVRAHGRLLNGHVNMREKHNEDSDVVKYQVQIHSNLSTYHLYFFKKMNYVFT